MAATENRQPLDGAAKGVKSFIERVGVMPAFLIGLVSFILRSAQTWSFGEFSISKLPPFLQVAMADLTGLGTALGMELLTGAAGAKWWESKRKRNEVLGNRRIPRQERIIFAQQFADEARLNLIFMCIGGASSIYTGVVFAITVTGTASLINVVTDVVILLLATVMMLYFAVFHEPTQVDPSRLAAIRVRRQVGVIVDAAGERVAAGTHTPGDVRVLQSALPRAEAGMLDPLIASTTDETWFSVNQLTAMFGHTDGGRKIRRVLKAEQDKGAPGVRTRPSGRGYEVAGSAMFTLFADELEKVTSIGASAAAERQSLAALRVAVSDAASIAGHTSDAERTPSPAFEGVPVTA